MLLKKNIIILLTLVLMLSGCESTTRSTTDTSIVIETPIAEEETAAVNVRTMIAIPVEDEEETPVVQEESKPSNWYIRIVAEDSNRALKTNSAQLGELEASDAVVKNTLISSGRFTGPYLDVVFVDPDGVSAGAYKTNYHMYEEGVEDRWKFTVKTDDKTAEIYLTWSGLYLLTPYTDDKNRVQYKEYRSLINPLIKNMKLIDVDTGKEIAASIDGKKQIYVLNMNDQNERVFEWVVQNEVVESPLASSKALSVSAKSIHDDVDKVVTTTVEKRAESFDLSKPPMFKGEGDGK